MHKSYCKGVKRMISIISVVISLVVVSVILISGVSFCAYHAGL